MVLRNACCAALVIESASSSRIILCRPGGRVTFFCANILILLRTTSMPRSSDAFSSRTASLYEGPRSACARQRTEVVFPMPGGPVKMRLGILPVEAIAARRSTASLLPTISSILIGRYFSTQGNEATAWAPFMFSICFSCSCEGSFFSLDYSEGSGLDRGGQSWNV